MNASCHVYENESFIIVTWRMNIYWKKICCFEWSRMEKKKHQRIFLLSYILLSYMWVRFFAVNASCHTHEWVRAMSHIRMNEYFSCHTMHVTRMNKWVRVFISHVWVREYVSLLRLVSTRCQELSAKSPISLQNSIYRHTLARYKSRHMTHSYYMTWNDSFIVYDVTHSYICHVALMYVTWFIIVIWNDAFLYMTWLLHTYDMTHGCIRHDSIRYMTWCIHVCEVTHSQWRKQLLRMFGPELNQINQ